MTEAVDAFVAAVTRGVRRSIFLRTRDLRDRRLGEQELNVIVANATRAAMSRAGVRDLAALAVGGAQVAASLETKVPEGEPEPAALTAWRAARDSADPAIINALLQVP